jgi:hypothetical protein
MDAHGGSAADPWIVPELRAPQSGNGGDVPSVLGGGIPPDRAAQDHDPGTFEG